MISYSIIIPHQDTPDLLQECLDSIPLRDDVQVIVVDDNSDTDKVDFDNFPQWKGNHYEYYLTKESRGAGYARNVGLNHAIGKWIIFADADDFFMPDLAKAMDEYVDTDWELVFFKGCGLVRPSRKEGHRADSINEFVDTALQNKDFRYLFTATTPTTKLYKHSFIEKHNIRFHEVRWSNDVYYGAQCAYYAEKYTASPTCIYCITNTEGSLTNYKTADCYRVRLIEAIDEISLLYPKFGKFDYYNYWFYRTWYNLWNTNRWEAIKSVPSCLKANNGYFFKYLWKYLLIDTYNSSSHLKAIIRFMKLITPFNILILSFIITPPLQFLTKINRVVSCQYNQIRSEEWSYVLKNKSILHFCFLYCKKWYTKLRYRMTFGEEMNMHHPKTFHEKLFWLSVYYRHPLIMQCADKYKVRDYIEICGCGDILNELYSAYDDVRDIEWDKLPNRFVIKNNKGSGDNFFCLEKSKLNIAEAVNILSEWKNHEYGIDTAEYQYYKIPFKLVCERYLLEQPSDEMMEYQFFCFNGIPASVLVRNDLETSGKQPFAVSYSIDWKREYLRINEEQFDIDVPKPVTFDKMVEYAKSLCAPFPHVRVDFYEVGGKLYFGELTFSTHGNVFSNYKESTLKRWNMMLTLPEKYCKSDKY